MICLIDTYSIDPDFGNRDQCREMLEGSVKVWGDSEGLPIANDHIRGQGIAPSIGKGGVFWSLVEQEVFEPTSYILVLNTGNGQKPEIPLGES
jgi:hypothetical protein